MSAPVINSAYLTVATGESTPNASIEVFATGAPDPSGAGEGRTYIGSTKADATGNWQILYTLTAPTTISATATNPNGSTSQFSLNATAEGLPAGNTYIVINTNDSGVGSLRQAILDANAHFGGDSIVFNIPASDPGYMSNGSDHYWRITPASTLPPITDSVRILGSTQASNEGNTNSRGPEIEIRGTQQMPYGLMLNGTAPSAPASNSEIEGLVINGFNFGLEVIGKYPDLIYNCNIHNNYLRGDHDRYFFRL